VPNSLFPRSSEVRRPEQDVLEILVSDNSKNLLNQEIALDFAKELVLLARSRSVRVARFDIRVDVTSLFLIWLAESFENDSVIEEVELFVQSAKVTGHVSLDYSHKLRKLKFVDCEVVDDIRVLQRESWRLVCHNTKFRANAEFLSNLELARLVGCSFEKQLFIHGDVGSLKVESCQLSDVRLAMNRLGKDTDTGQHDGMHSFHESKLSGVFSVDHVQGLGRCTLNLGGLVLAQGARLTITRSSLAINLCGVKIPADCELLIEQNDGREIDLRYALISSRARIIFRNQSLHNFLSAGTVLAQCSFSKVTFAEKDGHAYLADDYLITHIPVEYKPTVAFPDADVPKIHSADIPPSLVLDSYRQLIAYFDSTRDFRTSESLHFSEMRLAHYLDDIVRKDKWGKLGSMLNFASYQQIYKLLAGYGTSVNRAALILVTLLFVLFPLGFLGTGLNISKNHLPLGRVLIEHKTFALAPCYSINECTARIAENLSAYGYGTTYTIILASFQKEDSIQPANMWGTFLKALVAPVVLGQFALFIVALRRRFRRGAL
jgi:hypothetical protein